jgi:4,5-dihydroxyphthalate decarboxylase
VFPPRRAPRPPPVPELQELEQDYYRRTRIFPIMHTIVLRRALYEREPWVALSLYQAFCAAKERCYRWLVETGSLKVSLAFLQAAIEDERALFGPDWWAYGVESSRPSLEALLDYTYEQGLVHRRVAVEELFAPSTMRDIPLGEGQLI